MSNVTHIGDFLYRKSQKNLIKYGVKIYTKKNKNKMPGILLEQHDKKRMSQMWISANEVEDVIHILMEAYQTMLDNETESS